MQREQAVGVGHVEAEHTGVELARRGEVVDREAAEGRGGGQRSVPSSRGRSVTRMELDDLHVVAVGIDGRGEQPGVALFELGLPRDPYVVEAANDGPRIGDVEVEDRSSGLRVRGRDVVAVVDEEGESAEGQDPVAVGLGVLLGLERGGVPRVEPFGIGAREQHAVQPGLGHGGCLLEGGSRRRVGLPRQPEVVAASATNSGPDRSRTRRAAAAQAKERDP